MFSWLVLSFTCEIGHFVFYSLFVWILDSFVKPLSEWMIWEPFLDMPTISHLNDQNEIYLDFDFRYTQSSKMWNIVLWCNVGESFNNGQYLCAKLF